MAEKDPLKYSSTVDYSALDPVKIHAQINARSTAVNLERFGYKEISESRGESAYVWEEKDCYRAKVEEGLGTKNLIADEVRKYTGKTHYDTIAQDTVAMIVNDLIVVGAEPQVVSAHWAVGDSSWFKDVQRSRDLVEGWTNACQMAGATYGGGETPALKGIINPDTIELSGSAIGIIKPKERLTLGEKITEGDVIFAVASSGLHANAASFAREAAKFFPEGFQTKLTDGTTYGEALLKPTHIYASLVRDLLEQGIDVHYMSNITGHGWKKIMRANKEFTYVVDKLPSPPEEFQLIQKYAEVDDSEMYGNFNMGVGFVIIMPRKEVLHSMQTAFKNGFISAPIGHVLEGKRSVVIEPKGLIYNSKELDLR